MLGPSSAMGGKLSVLWFSRNYFLEGLFVSSERKIEAETGNLEGIFARKI
jgi:hypothetical protein